MARQGLKVAVAASALLLLAAARSAAAHGGDHDADMDPDMFKSSLMTNEPMDATLWAHITCMALAFGVLMPLGVVLGLARRYQLHAAVQVLATVLAVVGYFLGHAHGGRQYEPNSAHRGFASYVFALLLIQAAVGAVLRVAGRVSWLKSMTRLIRGPVRLLHRFGGYVLLLAGMTQIILGVIVSMGFCYESDGYHTSQCLSHFITGGAFLGFSLMMVVFVRIRGGWLQREGRAVEFYDSIMVMIIGFVELVAHRKFGPNVAWNQSDEHASMGIAAFSAGIVGFVLSWNGRRNVFPGLAFVIVGMSFMGHAQHTLGEAVMEHSMAQHGMFGLVMVACGASRILEILLDPKPGWGKDANGAYYLAPLCMAAAGVLFMAANEQQMDTIIRLRVSSVALINVCFAFALYAVFFFYILTDLWARLTRFDEKRAKAATASAIALDDDDDTSQLLLDEADGSTSQVSDDAFEMEPVKAGAA